jgi:hypothetical protein
MTGGIIEEPIKRKKIPYPFVTKVYPVKTKAIKQKSSFKKC